MNPKLSGIVREFLTAAAAALVAYGIGTDSLWLEVTGGIVAFITLLSGVGANEGWEVLSSLVRKVLSAVGGVMIYQGWVTPEKAVVLLGAASSLAAMGWTIWKKEGSEPVGRVPVILLLAVGVSLMLPSCAGLSLKALTPYGEVNTDAKGNVVFVPNARPITLPVFNDK